MSALASTATWLFLTIFVFLPALVAIAALALWSETLTSLAILIAVFTWTSLGLIFGAITMVPE